MILTMVGFEFRILERPLLLYLTCNDFNICRKILTYKLKSYNYENLSTYRNINFYILDILPSL